MTESRFSRAMLVRRSLLESYLRDVVEPNNYDTTFLIAQHGIDIKLL